MMAHPRSSTTAPRRRGRGLSGAACALFCALLLITSAQATDAPALTAVYQMTSDKGTDRFTLMRSPDRIEYRFDTGESQIWLQGADGIGLLRMFDQQQRSIEYTPGDLAALDATPDWHKLAQLVALSARKRLVAGDLKSWLTHDGRVLTAGGDARQRLLWSEALQLPLWWEFADARWELIGLAKETDFIPLNRYPILEYADIGDREKDPFARQLIHFGDGHAHPQGAH